MSKQVNFAIDGQYIQAGLVKIDRDKVYGFVQEVVMDDNSHPCTTGNILDDGRTILLSGSTSFKTVTDNLFEVEKQHIRTVTITGENAVLVPSSFDVDVELLPGKLEDVFNLEITAIYQLNWENETVKSQMLQLLNEKKVFRFVFNYRTDYEGADALLVANKEDVFALTGQILNFEFQSRNLSPLLEENAETDTEDENDFDFSML